MRVDPVSGARAGSLPDAMPLSAPPSNIDSSDTASPVAPRLPEPGIADDAPARQFLRAARQSLRAGHGGAAQEALERAESRLLTRDVDPRRANEPDANPDIARISAALRALGAHENAAALRIVDALLAGRS